ncbi:Na+ dependent nucleoside transporter C-terminus-domain-containing protein [Dichotomocladium elegans]|nr:Na+ dependent nucleoside transporter C-terminus-domain-containing protein [Dichotomocladium elegans]
MDSKPDNVVDDKKTDTLASDVPKAQDAAKTEYQSSVGKGDVQSNHASDVDKAEEGSLEEDGKKGRFRTIYSRFKPWFHLAMWLIFTGFLAAAYALQVPKGYNSENLVLGLIYAWFTLSMIFTYIPFTTVTKPFWALWDMISRPFYKLSKRMRSIAYGAFVAVVMIVTIFSIPESEDSTRLRRLIALFGLVVFLVCLVASSSNRRSINWTTVSSSMLLQFLLALFVFRSSAGHDIFQWFATFAQGYLGKSANGTAFLFSADVAALGYFAISVFPAIIFFAATVQMLYYVGALQWFLTRFAVIFVYLLQVSGAEAVVATASPFIGQGENALLVRPYLPYMTKSELHQVMTSGFATISGSVLFGYISMGVSGQALLTSCIMSIPCSLAVSKIRYPETEEPMTGKKVQVPPQEERPTNILHAAGNGAQTGMTISLCIAANLIAVLALLYAVNAALTWLGKFLTIPELTLQFITGYVFVPIAWLIGADNKDVVPVGRLMAIKIWANEFVAYNEMTSTYAGVLSSRSQLVATYALCGFANLSSVGIQIGTLGALAPSRTGELSKLAFSAMLCGAMSTWISASIAGMLA